MENKILEDLLKDLYSFLKERCDVKENLKSIVLKKDKENQNDPLGLTAFYDVEQSKITVFTAGRSIKDILKSFAHEFIHHMQFTNHGEKIIGCKFDFMNDPTTRKLELEAYSLSGMLFREWEENKKKNYVD